ncbi:MAG: DNA methyltransferase, partial [Crocinitomicaceae bacterium]
MQIIHGDCLEKLKELKDNSVDSVVTDPPYGINFMGKKWDYDVPQVDVWKECLRVLKPGGHALVACGTRTQHRMAVNLEDAGFEIRDIVAWVYGSGFPKSHNLGKSIDKLQGNEREVVGNKLTGGIKRPPKALKSSDEYDETRTNNYTSGQTIIQDTKGSSPYEGWGTALKPAMELWTLCRKPLEEKTVAKNVLKYGTGGINIDGCRVETEEKTQRNQTGKHNSTSFSITSKTLTGGHNQGRFPANFIHDGSDEVVREFPQTKSGSGIKNPKNGKKSTFRASVQNNGYYTNGDSGSASRFFYVAKASKRERNEGLEGFEAKQVFGDNGETYKGLSNSKKPSTNHHPTVKPIKLMQYLVRLITPKGGVCLDPYGGSGSTALGCIEEKVDCIIIEREAEYIEIIKARVKFYQMKPKELF